MHVFKLKKIYIYLSQATGSWDEKKKSCKGQINKEVVKAGGKGEESRATD